MHSWLVSGRIGRGWELLQLLASGKRYNVIRTQRLTRSVGLAVGIEGCLAWSFCPDTINDAEYNLNELLPFDLMNLVDEQIVAARLGVGLRGSPNGELFAPTEAVLG